MYYGIRLSGAGGSIRPFRRIPDNHDIVEEV